MKNIKRKLIIAGMTASSVGLLFQMTVRTSPAQPNDAALIAKAKGIHDRVLKLDTHNDIEPANFTADCNYTMRLTTQVNLPKMVEGDMDVSFMIVYVGQGPLTPEGYRQRIPAGGREVRRRSSLHRKDRARQHRPGADAGRRPRLAQEEPAHRRHRRRERISHRDRHQKGEGVLRPRRALHVSGPQRQQPARRFEYGRNSGLSLQQRTVAARPRSHRRDESPGHDGRSVASLEGRKHGSHAAFQGSGNCVAFRRARARRRQPQHGRRAIAGAQEERRRDSDRRFRILCQNGFERAHRGPREAA